MSIETLFETYAGAWEQRDADAIAALHTPDSTYHLHAAQEPAVGREAVRDAFAELFEQWPDIAFDLVSVRFGEDFWAVEWKVRTSAYEADLADIVTRRGRAREEQAELPRRRGRARAARGDRDAGPAGGMTPRSAEAAPDGAGAAAEPGRDARQRRRPQPRATSSSSSARAGRSAPPTPSASTRTSPRGSRPTRR